MTDIRRRLSRAATATIAVAATAATIGLAAPAHAQTWDHEDATGDTWRLTADRDGSTVTPAPEATQTDIATVSIKHSRRITMTVTGVDFNRETSGLIYEIRDGRREVWIDQRVGADRMVPRFSAYSSRGECTGARGSVDRAADVATVSVPRRCLGQPDAVRAGVGVVTYEVVNRRRFVVLADDGLTDGEPEGELVKSDRVPRGRGTVG